MWCGEVGEPPFGTSLMASLEVLSPTRPRHTLGVRLELVRGFRVAGLRERRSTATYPPVTTTVRPRECSSGPHLARAVSSSSAMSGVVTVAARSDSGRGGCGACRTRIEGRGVRVMTRGMASSTSRRRVSSTTRTRSTSWRCVRSRPSATRRMPTRRSTRCRRGLVSEANSGCEVFGPDFRW